MYRTGVDNPFVEIDDCCRIGTDIRKVDKRQFHELSSELVGPAPKFPILASIEVFRPLIVLNTMMAVDTTFLV